VPRRQRSPQSMVRTRSFPRRGAGLVLLEDMLIYFLQPATKRVTEAKVIVFVV
jgi:hypothetical protein